MRGFVSWSEIKIWYVKDFLNFTLNQTAAVRIVYPLQRQNNRTPGTQCLDGGQGSFCLGKKRLKIPLREPCDNAFEKALRQIFHGEFFSQKGQGLICPRLDQQLETYQLYFR